MHLQTMIQRNRYQDSANLMLITDQVKAMPGIVRAAAIMGTENNQAALARSGFDPSLWAGAGPNDILFVVEGVDPASVQAALARYQSALHEQLGRTRAVQAPRSLHGAVSQLPGANLCLISVPGEYAAYEAFKALRAGMNVQIFSDNVPVELEGKLKHLGRSLGLLVMGPGCGTSIIGGVPIGFANVVAPGPIGIVGASGTGIQEVTVLVDRLNSGISHAIGLGGRDLSDAVGGTSAQMALEALASDAGTKVVVLVSKPPGPRTAERIIQAVNDYPKPVVLAFLGAEPAMLAGARHVASNLEEAAAMAVSLTDGFHATKAFRHWAGESKDVLAGATGQIPPLPRRYLRGLFTGGTLAEEATLILEQYLGRVFSNVRSDPAARLADPGQSVAHTVLDLGDDAFTQGRPHPMIDPSYRTERLLAEWADPEVAVLLCDVVLGHGCHDHPAAGLAAAVREARLRYGEVTVIAHVCGTERDPQVLSIQRDILEAAGILVFPTNASAASAAGRLTQLCYERKST